MGTALSRSIPEDIFGLDTDDAFGYTTNKVVWVRDRWLGIPYYLLVFGIVLYVFGYELIWKGEHFKLLDVRGLAHIWYSHPTEGHCDPAENGCRPDFTALDRLPYCAEYAGASALPGRASCKIKDFVELTPGDSGDKIFVPTSVEVFTEARTCPRGSDDEHRCSYRRLPGTDCLAHGKYMCQTRDGERDQFYYVADAERYDLRFTSSFERNGIHGTSLEYPGYVGVCRRLRAPREPRTWAQRKRDQTAAMEDCDSADAPGVAMEKMACKAGESCATQREFDVGRDVVEGAKRQLDGYADFKLPGRAGDGSNARGSRDGARSSRDAEEEEDATTPGGPRPASLRLLRGHGRRAGRRVAAGSRLGVGESPRGFWDPAEREFVATAGDVFTLGRLLELAGTSLDLDHTSDGLSLRQAGTALEVRAVYSNMYHFYSFFGYQEVNYHYEVKELVMPAMERYILSTDQPEDYPRHRRYERQHGILVWFKVDGRFGFFSIVYLFIIVAAASALMNSAKMLVDLCAVYLHPYKQNYFHLKYEVSGDFSSMWSCSRCGYKNPPDAQRCKRVPQWYTESDVPRCSEPRPAADAEVTPFLGHWVDQTGSFYGGAVIRIAEYDWEPMEPPSSGSPRYANTYKRQSISATACELFEVNRGGETVSYTVEWQLLPSSAVDVPPPLRSTTTQGAPGRAISVSRAATGETWVLHPHVDEDRSVTICD